MNEMGMERVEMKQETEMEREVELGMEEELEQVDDPEENLEWESGWMPLEHGDDENDCELSLLEYWDKYAADIANERGWACWGTCETEEANCLYQCPNPTERARQSNTQKAYRRYVARLTVHMPGAISDISFYDVCRAMHMVQQEGGRNGPYEEGTMRTILSCLCDIFRFAQRMGHCYNVLAFYAKRKSGEKDVFELIDPSKSDEQRKVDLEEYSERKLDKPKSLTTWQMERLADLLDGGIELDGRCVALALIAYSGLRPAEARALCYNDVVAFLDHPDREYLNIYKIRDPKGNIKFKPKTDNGRRKVPVHVELRILLRRRMEYVKQHYQGDIGPLPICCIGNDFERPCKDYHLACLADELFAKIRLTAGDLLLFHVERDLDRMEKNAEKEDLEEALTIYALRRNFWSWLSGAGRLDEFQCRYVMGHKMVVNGKNLRKQYNSEQILWEICQKMDRAIFSKRLHQESIVFVLGEKEPVLIANRGIVQIEVPRELLMRGGVICVDVETVEEGDSILLEVLSGKRALGFPKEVTVRPWPVLDGKKVGINCEYENWQAHLRPTRPVSEKEQEKGGE